ncbi:hypothetical protein KXS07_36430 [Inquilinus limosus]|uniref:hypothetical protein n=1 Tax=Inquilinus limosus TaxID=171674 RepID=UPI003F187FC7
MVPGAGLRLSLWHQPWLVSADQLVNFRVDVSRIAIKPIQTLASNLGDLMARGTFETICGDVTSGASADREVL